MCFNTQNKITGRSSLSQRSSNSDILLNDTCLQIISTIPAVTTRTLVSDDTEDSVDSEEREDDG